MRTGVQGQPLGYTQPDEPHTLAHPSASRASAPQVNNITAAVKRGGPVVINLPAKTFDVSHTLYVNFTGAAAPGSFTLRGDGTVLDCGRRTALALFVVGAGSVSISGLTIQNCTVQGLNGESVLARACTA